MLEGGEVGESERKREETVRGRRRVAVESAGERFWIEGAGSRVKLQQINRVNHPRGRTRLFQVTRQLGHGRRASDDRTITDRCAAATGGFYG